MLNRSLKRASASLSHQYTTLLTRSSAAPKHRFFHATPAIMVKAGDSIPKVDLFEQSPGNKVDIADELASGTGVIVGVPAAFSPACSDTHIPGYLASPNLKNAGKVYVVSVNDAFVMNAWHKSLDEKKSSGVRFLADPAGEFTRALDLEFDGTAFFGNKRGKRYALKTENGKFTKVSVEEDPTKITVSSAEENL